MAFPVVPLAIAAGSILYGALNPPRRPNIKAADVSTPVVNQSLQQLRDVNLQLEQDRGRVLSDLSASGLSGSASGPALTALFSQGNIFRSRINSIIMDSINKAQVAQEIENTRVQNEIERIRQRQDEIRTRALYGTAANLAAAFAAPRADPGIGAIDFGSEFQGAQTVADLTAQSDAYLDSLNQQYNTFVPSVPKPSPVGHLPSPLTETIR